ncbi:MAG TPA: peptidylprolyl isomerase, partial [Spirochaetia bacterium]
KPAATVRLTKTESVTVSQFQKSIAALEAQAKRTLTKDERRQYLDVMIGNLLLLQAATRDNVVVSDAELKTSIANYEQQIGQAANLGRAMTDDELRQYLAGNGVTFDAFQKQLREQQTIVAYVKAKKKSMFDAVKAVTDQDIQDFYDANKARFFMDDMVTLRHIYIDTRPLTNKDDRDKASRRAADILRELKGGASFGDLVMKYSEDTKSKYRGGLLGTFFHNDQQSRQALGSDFFDAIFKLKKGETSGVLQSNLGYHIVQVSERLDARLLGLDDKVPPLNQGTVRDGIKNTILNQRQSETLNNALTSLVADLRKQAEVKVFDDNLTW